MHEHRQSASACILDSYDNADAYNTITTSSGLSSRAASWRAGANEESSATASAEREAVLVFGARRLASARRLFGPRYVTETEDSEHAKAGIDVSNTSASVDCEAHIFAQTYAQAAAKASVTGQCYGKHKSDKARGDIEARVNAQVYDTSKCSVELKRKGRSGTRTKARASTRTVSPLAPPCRLPYPGSELTPAGPGRYDLHRMISTRLGSKSRK